MGEHGTGDPLLDPLLDPLRLQQFLRAHHLPPLDRFGQHFLIDSEALADMVRAADQDPRVPVIEIGAGLGVLTRALAQVREHGPAPLIAVELDRRLIPILTERVRSFPSVRVVHADILRVNPYSLLPTPYYPFDVVGNIPYNITAPILRRFLGSLPRPRRLTIMVDNAVAEAIAAHPPDMSVRAISVQVYAEAHVARRRIPPAAFIPAPAVHSAALVLTTRQTPLVAPAQERAFFRIVRAGFSQRRKTLANALAATERIAPSEAAARLTRAQLDPRRRAETLTINEWKRLLDVWN